KKESIPVCPARVACGVPLGRNSSEFREIRGVPLETRADGSDNHALVGRETASRTPDRAFVAASRSSEKSAERLAQHAPRRNGRAPWRREVAMASLLSIHVQVLLIVSQPTTLL